MKLLEIVVGSAIVGATSAIAIQSLFPKVKKAHYSQAYATVGTYLKKYSVTGNEECPGGVNEWRFTCDDGHITATNQDLALSGLIHKGKPLLCKDTHDISIEDADLGRCPNLASSQ